MDDLQKAQHQCFTKHLPADPGKLIPGLSPNAKTRLEAGLFRVYVIVNNYRTNFDDFREVYLLGIQLDTE